MLKIGVLLPSSFEDAGDFLADARALDAAGADSLWIDGSSTPIFSIDPPRPATTPVA